MSTPQIEYSSTLEVSNKSGQEDDEKKQTQSQKSSLVKQSRRIQKYQPKKKLKATVGYENIISPYLYFHTSEMLYFHINGDFTVCISQQSDQKCILKKMKSITQFDRYVQCDIYPIEFLKEFDLPIKLLEKQQDLDKYLYAQQIKEYQSLSYKTIDYLKTIQNSYQEDLSELHELNQKRSLHRKQLINQYINENLKEDEFFTIGEIGTNFEFQQIEIKSLSMSKGVFALIGVEDQDLSKYLLHIGLVDTVFLSQSERFFGALIEILNSNLLNQYIRKKDFVINTLDDIKIYYEAELLVQQIFYPPELEYKCKQSLTYNLDYIVVMKYDVSYNHLKQILNYRQQNKQCLENEFISSVSIEYSLLSQVFLEKYYPHIQTPMQQQQQQIQQEEQQHNKTCSYRYLN